jgi:hypothetical protein
MLHSIYEKGDNSVNNIDKNPNKSLAIEEEKTIS